MAAFFNTALSQQQFLDQYWQQKPLLIRQAFADFESPITPDELAGLAGEADIESRLIEQHGAEGSWQLSNGPLTQQDFSRLAATHWTMLVQDVDKHCPDLQYLLDPFSFIPDWRRDDLMISYASEHGSVGPHTDGYDVFLLQAMGSRRWQISNKEIHNAALLDGLQLQILAEFEADQEWVLEPGDMLYLPPHFAHHGVALNECMTFSFGFRAPSQTDMLDSVINTLLENDMGKARYSDPGLIISPHQSEINDEAIARLKLLLHQSIDQAEPIISRALGKFVTETKSSLLNLAEASLSDLTTVDQINAEFEQGNSLIRNVYYRFAWLKNESGGQLFMAGEAYDLDINGQNNLSVLAENKQLKLADWQQLKQDVASANLLSHLIAEGGWFWQSDRD